MIDKLFICYETLNKFQEDLNAGKIKPTSIVFIEESHQIYTHGTYYPSPEIKTVLMSNLDSLNTANKVGIYFVKDDNNDINGVLQIHTASNASGNDQRVIQTLYSSYKKLNGGSYEHDWKHHILSRTYSTEWTEWSEEYASASRVQQLSEGLDNAGLWIEQLIESKDDLYEKLDATEQKHDEDIESINTDINGINKSIDNLKNNSNLEHIKLSNRISNLEEYKQNNLPKITVSESGRTMYFIDSDGVKRGYIQVNENVNNDNEMITYLTFVDTAGHTYSHALPVLRVNATDKTIEYSNDSGDTWNYVCDIPDPSTFNTLTIKGVLYSLPSGYIGTPEYEVGDLVYAPAPDDEGYSLYVCADNAAEKEEGSVDDYAYVWRNIPINFVISPENISYVTPDLEQRNVKQELDYLHNMAQGALWTKGQGKYSIKQVTKNSDANSVDGDYSLAEGAKNSIGKLVINDEVLTNDSEYSHAEGCGNTIYGGKHSHVEGSENLIFKAEDSHAEGLKNIVNGNRSHAEGQNNRIDSGDSHAEGDTNYVGGNNSHAEGHYTSSGIYDGGDDYNYADNTHTEGYGTTALEMAAHAEGGYSMERGYTTDLGTPDRDVRILLTLSDSDYDSYSTNNDWYEVNDATQYHRVIDLQHAEHYLEGNVLPKDTDSEYIKFLLLNRKITEEKVGDDKYDVNVTIIDVICIPDDRENSEGYRWFIHTDSTLSGKGYQAEQSDNVNNNISSQYFYIAGNAAAGCNSHVEGNYNYAGGRNSHVEGSYNATVGVNSHVEGLGNVAVNDNEHASGTFNAFRTGLLFSIGNGTGEETRSNVIEADSSGNVYIKGIGGYNGVYDSNTTKSIVSAFLQYDAVTYYDEIATLDDPVLQPGGPQE